MKLLKTSKIMGGGYSLPAFLRNGGGVTAGRHGLMPLRRVEDNAPYRAVVTQFIAPALGRVALVATIIGAFAQLPSRADVLAVQNGSMLTIRASSAYSGKGLVLLWDDEDRSESGDWTNTNSIPGVVSSSGSVFSVDLDALGVPNGAACRIAAVTRFNVLAYVENERRNGSQVDTGIKDTELYGLRFACYCRATDKTGRYMVSDTSSTEDTTSYFMLSTINAVKTYFRFYQNGGMAFRSNQNREIYYTQDEMTDFAMTNGVVTVNGAQYYSRNNYAMTYTDGTSFGSTGGNILLGGGGNGNNVKCRWKYVVMYGADGGEILNLTPVTRTSDGVEGFWDGVSKTFKTVNGSTAYIYPGTETGETIDADAEMLNAFTIDRRLTAEVSRGTLSVTVPAGLAGEDILLLWDDADKSASGDWAHTNVIASSVTAGATYTARLAALGLDNGQYAVLAARHNLSLFDKVHLHGGSNTSVDTGVKDADVYGVRMGYYITWANNGPNAALASHGTGFFRIGGINYHENYLRCYIQGAHNESSRNRQLYLWTDGAEDYAQINNVAATNGVFTLEGRLADYNGTARTANKFTAGTAFGSSANNVWMGWNGDTGAYSCAQSGFWSYLQMDDKDGNLILDLVPAKRNGDGVIGFYDRTRGAFLSPAGKLPATGGETVDASYAPVNAVGAAFRVASIPGMVIVVR